MKETDQSRFVRWAIPGWMMFISFFSFVSFDIVLSLESVKNSLASLFVRLLSVPYLNSTASAVAALIVVAAGIPLGFLIYQVYFYIRWNSPFSRDGFFGLFIVGRLNDLDRTLDEINESDIIRNDKWRIDWISHPLYKTDHGWKWRYIENFFIELVQELDSSISGVSLYARYRYLLEINAHFRVELV